MDGHSHDYDKVVMKNKDGRDVLRAASGTKLHSIGVLTITTDGKIDSTLLAWGKNYPADAASLLNLNNPVVEDLLLTKIALYAVLDEVVAQSAVDLTIDDPLLVDENGQPVRIIRQAETNLGDLCADAFRYQTGAEIGVVNGGGIRVSIEAGDITYGGNPERIPFRQRAVCGQGHRPADTGCPGMGRSFPAKRVRRLPPCFRPDLRI